jgi:hypothetical protein
MKCPYLVNLFTTTRIKFLPTDVGRPSMKSMVSICQAEVGTGRVGDGQHTLTCQVWTEGNQPQIA